MHEHTRLALIMKGFRFTWAVYQPGHGENMLLAVRVRHPLGHVSGRTDPGFRELLVDDSPEHS
jgi:hypothetical protein